MTDSADQNAPVSVRGPISTRDIINIAWPIGMKAILLHGIVVIDTYLVSPLGETAVAAMGLAGAIVGLLFGLLFAFSSATQIRVARAFGSAGETTLKTAFYCGLLQNFVAASLGIFLVVLWGSKVVVALAHNPQTAELALSYLGVMLFVVASEAIGQCLSSYFNGCGRTRVPLVGYLISVPMNFGISIVLIYGLYGFPELGVQGAAYGTLVASLTRLLVLGFSFLKGTGGYFRTTGWAQPTFQKAMLRHLVFSWPIAATFVSMSFGTQVSMLICANLNINQFAALTLMMPWVQAAGTFGMAWAHAVGILIAQILGKGASSAELEDFLLRARRGAVLAAGFVALTYLVICLSSGWIYSELQAETKAVLLTFLPILLLVPFPKGWNAICGQTLRASGDTVFVMNVFVAAQWFVRIPLTVLFVLVLGLSATWVFALLLLDELFKLPLFHFRVRRGMWKTPKAL